MGADQEHFWDETLVDCIVSEGELVFSHSDALHVLPGSQPRSVYYWRAKYAVSHPDLGDFGPYDSMLAALHDNEDDLLTVTSGTGSLACSLLETSELMRLLQPMGEELEIDINGERWLFRGGDWTRP